MVFRCTFSRSSFVRLAIAASTAALLTLPAAAQSQSQTQFSPALASGSQASNSEQYSSSAEWKESLATYDLAAAPKASASGQYGQYGQYGRRNSRYPNYQSRWSHLAFEIGVGPTAPIGNDVSGGRDVGLAGYNTWGYNVTVGAGWNFSKYLGTLIEYSFNRTKIPGKTLAALGVPGGNINTWSLTLDPIIYLPMSHSFGAYVTGGGGFYRKVTNFTAPTPVESCYYFCYYGYANQTIGHFSSNQGGLNIGLGTYWNAFGPDSHAKLYAEARYVWVDSPRLTSDTVFNGEGTEGLIPVTLGIRF